MKIELKKFGTILVSRQTGREALAAFRPTLREVHDKENIEIDFDGVSTFSPSWGDEFLRPLYREYKNRLVSLTTKYTLDEFKDNNKRYFQDINDNNNTSNIQSNIQLKTTNESVNPAKKVKLMYKQIQK